MAVDIPHDTRVCPELLLFTSTSGRRSAIGSRYVERRDRDAETPSRRTSLWRPPVYGGQQMDTG